MKTHPKLAIDQTSSERIIANSLRTRLLALRTAGIEMVMEGEGDEGTGDDKPDADKPTLTQAAFDKAIGARIAAEKAKVTAALGMDPAEAKKILDAAKKAEHEKLDETERLKVEASESRASAAEAERKGAEAAHASRVALALIKANVPASKLDMTTRLVVAAPGIDDAGLTAAIEEVRAAAPEFFKADTAKIPDTGSGGTPPGSSGSPTDARKAGEERAKARIAASGGGAYSFLKP